MDAEVTPPTVDQIRRLDPLQQVRDKAGNLALVVHRIKQQQELVAADAAEQIGTAQVEADPLCELLQERIADRMTIVVVDVLEVVDVHEDEREILRALAGEQFVDAPLDQPSGRHSRQLVVIGKTIELALAGSLRRDVDGAGQQQRPVRKRDRPVRGQEFAIARRAAEALFTARGLAGAQCFDAKLLPSLQLGVRKQLWRFAREGGEIEVSSGGLVDEQKVALVVLDRYADGKLADHVVQFADRDARVPLSVQVPTIRLRRDLPGIIALVVVHFLSARPHDYVKSQFPFADQLNLSVRLPARWRRLTHG